MLYRPKPQENVKICAMGKKFPITAIADNDDDANRYMAKTKDEGVIACFGKLVIIASFYESSS